MLLSLVVYLSLAQALASELFMPPSPYSCQNTRTLRDIIWRCMVMVFTWIGVAIRPNMPNPGEHWTAGALRRLQFLVLGLIAPELLTTWALRQWIVARKIRAEYQRERIPEAMLKFIC